MKDFEDIVFNPARCRRKLREFASLLRSKENLSEQIDLRGFFKKRQQLSAFIGTVAPEIGPATQLAFEFPIFGDFAADITLGNRERGEYCLIELEEGLVDTIFTRVKNRSTKKWGRKFEHGFSQLVDWFYWLDDLKKTERFAKDFGHGHIRFFGLLIIARNAGLGESERARLKWRTEKVLVDSHSIHCLTFDDLHQILLQRMSYSPQGSKFE